MVASDVYMLYSTYIACCFTLIYHICIYKYAFLVMKSISFELQIKCFVHGSVSSTIMYRLVITLYIIYILYGHSIYC